MSRHGLDYLYNRGLQTQGDEDLPLENPQGTVTACMGPQLQLSPSLNLTPDMSQGQLKELCTGVGGGADPDASLRTAVRCSDCGGKVEGLTW